MWCKGNQTNKMGLDMYLSKRTYIGANYEHNNVKGKIEITTNKKPINIKLNRISYIEEQVAYWRKANHIHNWFVTHCQGGADDCREPVVSKEQLLRLLADCKEVKENPSLKESVMPTTPGFFFGGTEYDTYYFEDIDYTIKVIEDLIAEYEGEDNFDVYYSSSW